LHTIKKILARYSSWLWALLAPLGAWGVFAIAAIDGSFLGLPLDAIVAAYVYQNRERFLLYVLMASAGSALGSLVIYGIGYLGGEAFLHRRIPPERFAKIHASFDKHPFWGLMFPAILPPPTPFKLFVLAAAVTEMPLRRFLLAIFSGRLVRFLILSLLTLRFGPQIVQLTAELARHHSKWILAAAVAVLLFWLLLRRTNRRKNLGQVPDSRGQEDAPRRTA